MINFLKNNPFKSIMGVLGIIGVLITSVWAADARFNQMPQIHNIEQSIQYQRRQTLEDNIMVLEMKMAGAKQDTIDKALLERYKSRLNRTTQK